MKNTNQEFEDSLENNNLLDRFIAIMFYSTVITVILIIAAIAMF